MEDLYGHRIPWIISAPHHEGPRVSFTVIYLQDFPKVTVTLQEETVTFSRMLKKCGYTFEQHWYCLREGNNADTKKNGYNEEGGGEREQAREIIRGWSFNPSTGLWKQACTNTALIQPSLSMSSTHFLSLFASLKVTQYQWAQHIMVSTFLVYEHIDKETLYHTLYMLGCVRMCKRQLVVQGDQVQWTHMLTHTYTHTHAWGVSGGIQ